MKLLRVSVSKKPGKKYDAIFETDEGRQKTTSFGAAGMDDYTKTHDTEQRARYRQRHAKDLKTGDPTKAGFLSYYLLWGEHTNLQDNIAAYRKRFRL